MKSEEQEDVVITYGTMKKGPLWDRTKQFALRVIRLYVALPKKDEAQVIGHQMLRSGTSPGAQYREACRARSIAEFISKMTSGLQELEETAYWLELLVESGIIRPELIGDLRQENEELIAMFVASINTAERNKTRQE